MICSYEVLHAWLQQELTLTHLPLFVQLQFARSLLATQPGGAQPFPQLAQGWAASHRGKAVIDQVGGCGGGALLRMELPSTLTGHSQLCCRCLYVFAIIAGA